MQICAGMSGGARQEAQEILVAVPGAAGIRSDLPRGDLQGDIKDLPRGDLRGDDIKPHRSPAAARSAAHPPAR